MPQNTNISWQKTIGFLKGLLRSYSQVFFSDHLVFASLLLIVTFIDWHTGVAGLLSVLVSNSLALILGLDRSQVEKGSYGFNALLTGLGVAFFFGPSPVFFLVLAVGGALSLFLSVVLQGVLGKYGLPFLSLPFILALWILNLGAVEFSYLGLSERGVFSFNYLFGMGGKPLVDLMVWWNEWLLPSSPIITYFKSLAAILFMQDVLPGVIVAIGLLLYSRMALSLSLLGFVSAFFFYEVIGADFSSLNYSYIGFNYILTSIALGGFFLVPSWRSYLTSLLIIPLVATFSIGLTRFLAIWYLPVYALPFNLTVLMVLYVLRMRGYHSGRLSEVYIQHNSPEKNFYAFYNFNQRFGNKGEVAISLPFFGAWTVNQGHRGEITHRGEWQYAWDFVIEDDSKEYANDGRRLSDYYCYDKQIVAPAAGVVEQVIDYVPDNAIGETNLQQNWGNTIVVKAGAFLYYKLSHLKPGSVEVKVGDTIKEGQALGRCGNSGRSPYPHLHFQIQQTPYIGSPTLRYAISSYLLSSKEGRHVVTYDFPLLGQTVENVYSQTLLKNALQFKPGQRLKWEQDGELIIWEVKTTVYNQTYLECTKTGCRAWFDSGGSVFWFTHFEGSRHSLLYLFFLALFKVPLVFEAGLDAKDEYPVNLVFSKFKRWFQDFVAPFRVFLTSTYHLQFQKMDDPTFPSSLTFKSATYTGRWWKKKMGDFTFEINNQGIQSFEYQWKNKKKQKIACKY